MLKQAVESEKGEDEASAIIRVAYQQVEKRFAGFIERMHGPIADWITEGNIIVWSVERRSGCDGTDTL